MQWKQLAERLAAGASVLLGVNIAPEQIVDWCVGPDQKQDEVRAMTLSMGERQGVYYSDELNTFYVVQFTPEDYAARFGEAVPS